MKRYLHSLQKLALILIVSIVAASLFHLPVAAQAPGITAPGAGQTISGVVIVQGTASSNDFLRYELAFLRDDDPGTGWIVFADGDQQVFDGTLAVWDTTVGQNVNAPVFPDGSYQLRLRVVRTDFNFDEYFAGNLIVQNGTPVEVATQEPLPPPPTETPLPTDEPAPQPPTEVPTEAPVEQPTNETVVEEGAPTTESVEAVAPTATQLPTETPTSVPTSTPLPTREAPTAIPTIILQTLEPPPEVLPTLTPFPSPTPIATAEQTAFNVATAPEDDSIASDEPGGVNGALESVLGFDYSQFGSAFGLGFRWALIGFAVIGVYLFVRFVVRWLWQTISSNW